MFTRFTAVEAVGKLLVKAPEFVGKVFNVTLAKGLRKN
jgi:hypothetical protein